LTLRPWVNQQNYDLLDASCHDFDLAMLGQSAVMIFLLNPGWLNKEDILHVKQTYFHSIQ
jgi:hypothetical protein